MVEIANFLFENYEVIGASIAGAIVALMGIARITPNKVDDKYLQIALNVLNKLGFYKPKA